MKRGREEKEIWVPQLTSDKEQSHKQGSSEKVQALMVEAKNTGRVIKSKYIVNS